MRRREFAGAKPRTAVVSRRGRCDVARAVLRNWGYAYCVWKESVFFGIVRAVGRGPPFLIGDNMAAVHGKPFDE